MLTKFKIFEKINLKYKVGDLVILDIDKLIEYYSSISTSYNKFVKFLNKIKNDNIQEILEINNDDFEQYKFKHKKWGNNSRFYFIDESHIYGKATPENVEKYRFEKAVKKYNL